MSDSVTTSVEVAVSPDVAFDVFTREIDAWYRVDPDTLPDITRTAAIRLEPHVGGRLLDVHDIATGAGREMGRVTAWEPARRLAFADNEGTEVEVSFEACDAGTRVTLTHRGLDRLTSSRAAQLRRSGWAALAPFYRDHLAPTARPLALALASFAVVYAVVGGSLWLAFTLAGGQPSVWIWAGLLAAAAIVVHGRAEDRLVRRWLPSGWQYGQISNRVMGLVALGLLVAGLYRAVQQGDDVIVTVGLPVLLLMAYWSGEQQGPARGWSARKRAGWARDTFARRHPHVWIFCLLVGAGALIPGLIFGISLIDQGLAGPVFPALVALAAAISLHAIASKRRERKTLGFDADLYLAVARRVSEEDRRPALLVHRPSQHPEYSGWYAYASEQDEGRTRARHLEHEGPRRPLTRGSPAPPRRPRHMALGPGPARLHTHRASQRERPARVARRPVKCETRPVRKWPGGRPHPPYRFVIGTRRSRPKALEVMRGPGGCWRRSYSAKSRITLVVRSAPGRRGRRGRPAWSRCRPTAPAPRGRNRSCGSRADLG